MSKNKTNSTCDDSMTFEECELAILRSSVDNAVYIKGSNLVNDPAIIKLIGITENFIRDKKLICYGGTAINNILPKKDRFYDLDSELPDYDVYSPDGMADAIELADIYHANGYTDIEAKAGMHDGTYKVFVNFIPVADITTMNKELFRGISKDAVIIDGIKYTPINYLRMSMYKELSRPKGDISRWEKVMKRLTLLNKNFPLKGKKCDTIDIQRVVDKNSPLDKEDIRRIFVITRENFIKQKVVFFGAVANRLYMRHYDHYTKELKEIPDFDILAKAPLKCANELKDKLTKEGYNHIRIVKHPNAGEVIPEHYEVIIDGDTIAFIYKAFDCHSYNSIKLNGKNMKIASIDTMLNMYLAFLYMNRPYYDKNRIICMSEFLFKVQDKNRLKQKGILKRFTINCYGNPVTKERIKSRRNNLHKKLKRDRSSKKYRRHFLKYTPGQPSRQDLKSTIRRRRIPTARRRKTRKIFKNIFKL